MNTLRRNSINNQVIRVPSHYEEETKPVRQLSQSHPTRQSSQTPNQGMTANYNLTFVIHLLQMNRLECHSPPRLHKCTHLLQVLLLRALRHLIMMINDLKIKM